MKKYAVLMLIVAFVLGGCAKKEKKFTVALSGIVNFTVGNSFIKDAAGERPAKPGDAVSQGMIVSTKGEKSIMDIYIGGSAVRLVGTSSVEFNTLIKNVSGGENVSITVVNGSCFNRIAGKLAKEDSYTVKTKTVVASVRGTEFFVSDENGKSNVSCLDGKVAVADNAGAEVILDKNEQADAAEGSDLVKKQIEADQLNKLKLMTDIKAIQEDIKQKYEDQKAEIQKKFEEQKAEIQKAVTDQKEKDKANVENQKATDAQNIEDVKGRTQAAVEEAKGNTASKDAATSATTEAQSKMNESKNVDTSSILDAVKKQKEAIKQQTESQSQK